MKFKLIVVLTVEKFTGDLITAGREAGATGVTVVSHGSGEGIEPLKSFLGASLANRTDLILFLVEEHMCRSIMDTLVVVGQMKDKHTGIAFQLDVEDAVGISRQISELVPLIDEKI
ncbi:MAG: P-II family nitrogen regulator [Gammaproteobacteria bacterium]|nr:P-II family nitrogen regulator [Gammaproteobacteria bacterium]